MLDKKRIVIVTIFITLVILVIGAFLFFNSVEIENNIVEYTPEEEITDKQLRQTSVVLYFKRKDKLEQELRRIDVKELINNPYEKVVNMLIEGPKNENLEKTIPEGTKLNRVEKIGEKLIVDLSKEFIENYIGDENNQKITIGSIVKTLTELTEINEVQIKIDGEENKRFKNEGLELNVTFRKDFI